MTPLRTGGVSGAGSVARMGLAGACATWAALVVGLAVFGVACGGESTATPAEYERTAQERVDVVAAGVEELARELERLRAGSASLEDVVVVATRVGEDAEDAATELDRLDPPPGADVAHDELVASLEAFGRDLEEFVAVVEERNANSVRAVEAGAEGLASLARVERACQSLRSAGYDVTFAAAPA